MPAELDHHDAEHIDDTVRTPGYTLIQQRIRDDIAKRVRALIDDGEDVPKERGMILGMELALRIPGIIAAEAKATKRKKDGR